MNKLNLTLLILGSTLILVGLVFLIVAISKVNSKDKKFNHINRYSWVLMSTGVLVVLNGVFLNLG